MTPLTIDIAPLYNPIDHRYRGVYPDNRAVDKWDAIVKTPLGKLKRVGRFSSQEGAARAVALYYYGVHGRDWPNMIGRGLWRVKRVLRYLNMSSLHKGPATVVYTAEVRCGRPGSLWIKLEPADLTEIEGASMSPSLASRLWDEKAGGWKTEATALVIIRLYRSLLQWSSQPGRLEGSAVPV